MKNGKDGDDTLRRKAEGRLRSQMDLAEEICAQDARGLIHELRVHQIELEMQNEELRRSQAQLNESRTRYADLYDFAPVGYLTFDREGLIVEANLTAAKQLGKERARILKRPFFLYVLARDRDSFHLHLAKVFKTGERRTCEVRLAPGIGEEFYARLDSIFIEDANGEGLARTSISDISYSKRAEETLQRAHDELEERVRERTSDLSAANEQLRREMEERRLIEIRTQAGNALLKLLNEVSSRKEYLNATVEEIRKQTGCCCVGIRVMNKKYMIPYESFVGFSREFWESENLLSIIMDYCVCTRIIAEQMEPIDAPYMTGAGAFLCSDISELAASLTEEEKGKFRGSCIRHGFRTVAIIPVRYGGKMVGAIHLADKRAGMVSQEQVAFIESLAKLIGAALYRFDIQNTLQQNYDTQNVVNLLLRLSLEDISLDELLGRGLDLLLSIPWLSFESKGCIFGDDHRFGQ